MKMRSLETLGSRRVSKPRVITLQERAIADHDQAQGGEACSQTYSWVRPSNYTWAIGAVGVTAVGLGLHFYYYYLRDALVSLALFSLLFFSLSLVVLSACCICYAGNQAAIWAGPASRAVVVFFRQQGHGETELAPVLVVEDSRRPSDQRNEV